MVAIVLVEIWQIVEGNKKEIWSTTRIYDSLWSHCGQVRDTQTEAALQVAYIEIHCLPVSGKKGCESRDRDGGIKT